MGFVSAVRSRRIRAPRFARCPNPRHSKVYFSRGPQKRLPFLGKKAHVLEKYVCLIIKTLRVLKTAFVAVFFCRFALDTKCKHFGRFL